MVMEAEASHFLWSAALRPRRRGGMGSSSSLKAWDQESQRGEILSPRTREGGSPSSTGSENDWVMPTQTGEGNNLTQKPSQTPRNNI